MDSFTVLPADTVLWDAAFLEAALALEALVRQHRSNYEIETHPEWLTVSN